MRHHIIKTASQVWCGHPPNAKTLPRSPDDYLLCGLCERALAAARRAIMQERWLLMKREARNA